MLIYVHKFFQSNVLIWPLVSIIFHRDSDLNIPIIEKKTIKENFNRRLSNMQRVLCVNINVCYIILVEKVISFNKFWADNFATNFYSVPVEEESEYLDLLRPGYGGGGAAWSASTAPLTSLAGGGPATVKFLTFFQYVIS